MANYLIFGDRSARAAFLAQRLPQPGDRVWFVAQGRFQGGLPAGVEWHWVEEDAHVRGAGARIAQAFTGMALDVCLVDAPSAPQSAPPLTSVMYLTTTILCLQTLMPAVQRASSARILLLGASPPSSADDAPLGIRTVAQALRELSRPRHTAITCLYTSHDASHDASPHADVRRADLLALVRCLLALSPHSAVPELELAAL